LRTTEREKLQFLDCQVELDKGGPRMTLEQARKIVGNQPTYALRNMVKALMLHHWLNTEDDWKRLKAAQLILRKKEHATPLILEN
tara:strand:+ start:122 stop:376 length:255 start_codon:yes stop_codon:yes gene_type:complete